jgi:hypothetical protein
LARGDEAGALNSLRRCL